MGHINFHLPQKNLVLKRFFWLQRNAPSHYPLYYRLCLCPTQKVKRSCQNKSGFDLFNGISTFFVHTYFIFFGWTMLNICPCSRRYLALPIALALSLSMLALSLFLPAQYSTEILLSILFWTGQGSLTVIV